MLASLFAASLWAALAAAIVSAIASLLFLRTRNFFHDSLALASTEIGLLILAAGIVAGVAASRMAGGLWWTWNAQLTTALVCFLLYAPYLMLRQAIEEPTRRASSAAVVSLFAIFNVPAIVVVVNWWLAHKGVQAAMPDAVAYLPPLFVFGIALAAFRFRQEQRRRAADAVRRTAQEI